jgi:hypothetical protein
MTLHERDNAARDVLGLGGSMQRRQDASLFFRARETE